jgi:nitrite reductase (NO-forming)
VELRDVRQPRTIRAAFRVIWAIDAFFTWRLAFTVHYVGYLHNTAQ